LDEALQILGGLERDFNCASLCKRSPLFAFSDVSVGPPRMSCMRAVVKKVARMAQFLFWGSSIFALVSLIGLVFTLMITFDKRGELNEPLLHGH